MADIRLVKPQPNTAQTVSCAADSRFVFEFPSDTALFAKDGNDLVLTFEDGSSLRLQNFYTTYSKEEMPTFEMEGTEISGEDFFAALGNPDLMPAAGPSASAQGNSSFNVYDSAALMDGIDRLDGLDIGFAWGQQPQEDLYASIGRGDDDEGVDHGVTLTPGNPGTPDDNTPVIDNPDNPHDTPSEDTIAERDVLGVDEADLGAGTPVTANGHMMISAPDGVASIVIGGVPVIENGVPTGETVATDEGYLEVTGFDASTGRLDYTYHLIHSTQEHEQKGQDKIAHELVVTVTDTDGSVGSGVILVEIRDDVPSIESFTKEVDEGATTPVEGNVLDGAVAGADGAHFAWAEGQTGTFGQIDLNEDGTYSYILNNNDPRVQVLKDGETLTEEFTYTYTDADGDIAEGKVTITINGKNNGVEVTPSDPSAGSEVLKVYEAGLEDGSDASKPTTAEGSLSISAPDGVSAIVIGGVTVFEKGALTGETVSTAEGTLTVTGFDAATGKLDVAYELTGNTTDHSKPGMDNVSHDFAVTVTDTDGSEASSTITVTIVDDVPTLTVKDLIDTVESGATSNIVEGQISYDFWSLEPRPI